ncbi:helix-turn-helix domain-containing protein [Escherichia coli]|uniref:helix-turn-helix domain-containing protein n=1 Tax=Escherichia coli TaxID=562 RepID=UPI001592D873|nr:helix-turn-helix transcriptional regulator [Escherichia coli]
MNTTPDAGRQAVARLIVQARTNLQWSQAELATRANMGNKTIHNVENAAFPPRRASLTKLENALGLISGSLTDVLNHHDPASVTLDQIQGTTPATPLATVSDADLIWELTNRLQTRAARLDQLQTSDTTAATPPLDAYALAADLDRSGHGRHLAEQTDTAGEEDQS